jgi:glycosyltransferase involved in cell wall biosynthesis
MLISLVIPAFNEEAYLGETLASVNCARTTLENEESVSTEIIVVDNCSNDSTADVARTFGAGVVTESRHSVSKARNSGAQAARGDVLVFVDADTLVPEKLLVLIGRAMSDLSCLGGAVDTEYLPRKRTVRLYLKFWRVMGRLMGMAQGATQFCRRDVFVALNGYDETLFMGEDADFYWRLKRIAKRRRGRVVLIDEVKVIPATRRFDQWRLWRTLVWTNPLFILLFRRRRTFWHGWYKTAPR